ncbi:hypothetical protein MHAS_00525 [Mycolicibacterium hassiacum DSM 44199]|uniref:hypothetical protein n=1 Tax=Mycolicibacterium hassiacum TaxID=46351 RepID=UPI000A9227D6|nr:hypothetical protein [Mycolicibacterium hassiacum]VCT88841.1 hypothetical protein MHAS_00525 [Mycolicibacterium hassiacum DSM 44199]
MLSHYDGAGRGWAESSLAPAEFNRRSSSDAQDDKVLLTAITGKPPQGFEQVRPGAWCALVPLSDCEIFERVYTANLNGVPARLLRHGDGKAHVLLLTDDPQAAQRGSAARTGDI